MSRAETVPVTSATDVVLRPVPSAAIDVLQTVEAMLAQRIASHESAAATVRRLIRRAEQVAKPA